MVTNEISKCQCLWKLCGKRAKLKDIFMFQGLQALILIVKKAKPNITAAQQDIIIDCLKLPDESLQLKVRNCFLVL